LGTPPLGLTGTGLGTTTAAVSFTPPTLDFGNLEAGSTSAVRTVTLKNTSSASTLSIASVTASGGYSSTDDCSGKVLAAGGTCTISVKFAPFANLVPLDYPGAVSVTDGDPTGVQVIGLSGSGVAPVNPSPRSLDLGVIYSGNTSPAKTVTFTNIDSSAETPTLAATGAFALSHSTCTSSLAPQATCKADVTFGPGTPGSVIGVLSENFSSGGFLSPQIVNLSGCLTEVNRIPETFNFGLVTSGVTSAPETLTIKGGAFNFTGFTLSGTNAAEFAIANNTCSSTSGSATCSLDVTFTPAAGGVRTATLQIADDQNCSPQPVSLVGGSSAGPFILTGVLNGLGGGNLNSNPTGLDCGSQGTTCSVNFTAGRSVTVAATPDASSEFAGWNGACSGASTCQVTMDADRQAIATFTTKPSLTVSISGNTAAVGRVTSAPPGIDCQLPQGAGSCQSYFSTGTSVTLTAAAGTGTSFDGWSGPCSGKNSCTVTMNADQNIGGSFTGPPTISVTPGGNGAGTVTSTPAGINCPSSQCSSVFPSGTTVSLTASAASGSGFDGWSGPCSGTGSCSFTATSDQNVMATFDLPDFSVAVSPPSPPTIFAGGSTSFVVAVTALGGFSDSVSLSCSAPPNVGVKCGLSPGAIKPGGSATMTITTSGPSGALKLPGLRSIVFSAAWILVPGLLLIGNGHRREKRKKSVLRWLFCATVLIVPCLELGCGGSNGPKSPGTPAGTYTINVNATAGAALQHTTPVTVVVD